MSDSRIKAELDCLERALDEKIDYFQMQDKELTRKEIANTLSLMKMEIIVHLRHIFN